MSKNVYVLIENGKPRVFETSSGALGAACDAIEYSGLDFDDVERELIETGQTGDPKDWSIDRVKLEQ